MKNSLWSLLVNPFTHIAGWKAFVLGIIIVCVTVLIGYFSNIYFPGALDVKVTTRVSLKSAYVFQMIGLASLVLVMYLSSLIFAKRTRFQDILGTVTLSRFPLFFTALSGFLVEEDCINNLAQLVLDRSTAFNISDYVGFIIVMLLMIPVVIWQIALLYNAFKVSTGMKGGKCIVVFIGSVILAEIISIILIYIVL